MNNDDKLREASERVAKRWLPERWEDEEGTVYVRHEQWISVYDDDEPMCPGQIKLDNLASPWGMDLLLDAAENRRVTVKYENLIAADNKGIVHEWYIFAPPSSYDDGERQIGFGDDTNRYAALIFALDRATLVLEGEKG